MAFTVRTDDELERALSELARAEGASRQDVVRRAVLDRYEETLHRECVVRSTQRVMERWANVIERIASTSGPEYLNLDDATFLIRVLDVGPVRDLGLLDSALARPRSSAFCRMGVSVSGGCAPWRSDLNGHDSSIGDTDAVSLVVDVAGGSLELTEIARRLNVVAQDTPTPSQPNVKS